jgi:uncharacterized protein (TIGR03083 family)
MSFAVATETEISAAIADEFRALADLLEGSPPEIWDAPSLCEGWRTREVVAHMTMPARYPPPRFLAELEAAGGDFTRLSNTVAARDAALPVPSPLADLRSEVLHAWRPPGGEPRDALTHCIIHQLDITEALALNRRVPAPRLTGPAAPRFTRKPARRTAGSNGELFERLTGHGWPLSARASPACLTREEERSSVRAGLGYRISGGLSACCS